MNVGLGNSFQFRDDYVPPGVQSHTKVRPEETESTEAEESGSVHGGDGGSEDGDMPTTLAGFSQIVDVLADGIRNLPKDHPSHDILAAMKETLDGLEKFQNLTAEEKGAAIGILKQQINALKLNDISIEIIRGVSVPPKEGAGLGATGHKVERLGAGGAAKIVLTVKVAGKVTEASTHVFLVARNTSTVEKHARGETRRDELKREVNTVKDVREKLQGIRLSDFLKPMLTDRQNNKDSTLVAQQIIVKFRSIDNFIDQMEKAPDFADKKKLLTENGIADVDAHAIASQFQGLENQDKFPKNLEKLKHWGDAFPKDLEMHTTATLTDTKKAELGLDKAAGVEELGPEFASVSRANRGDMESFIRSKEGKSLTADERIDMAEQVMQAMDDLHATGYVHGDLKPDNFLIHVEMIDGKRKVRVILNDFGTTETSKPGLTYMGNPRNRSPQNDKSQMTDVYATKNIVIRILEQPHLDRGQSLVPLDKNNTRFGTAPSAATTKGDSGLELKRQGFENYITAHKDCCQEHGDVKFSATAMVEGNVNLWAKLKVATSRMSSRLGIAIKDTKKLAAEEAAVKEYTRALDGKLEEEIGRETDSKKKEALKDRKNRLMNSIDMMGKAEVGHRANMDDALAVFRGEKEAPKMSDRIKA